MPGQPVCGRHDSVRTTPGRAVATAVGLAAREPAGRRPRCGRRGVREHRPGHLLAPCPGPVLARPSQSRHRRRPDRLHRRCPRLVPDRVASEAAYALIVEAFGYQGLVALRFVLGCTFYALLGRFLHRHYPAWVGGDHVVRGRAPRRHWCCRTGRRRSAWCSAPPRCRRSPLAVGRTGCPQRWWALPLTWCWANLHGLWVLVPALFFLAGGHPRCSSGPSTGGRSRSEPVASAAGALTPVGPKLLLAPLLIRSSTREITEWQRTALLSPVAWGLAGCLLILLAAWGRAALSGRTHARWSFAVVVTVFGLMALPATPSSRASCSAPLVAAAAGRRPCRRCGTTATVPRPLCSAPP